MYEINDKEVVVEGERNHHNNIWDIIIKPHLNDKMIVQTKNYTTIASYESI